MTPAERALLGHKQFRCCGQWIDPETQTHFGRDTYVQVCVQGEWRLALAIDADDIGLPTRYLVDCAVVDTARITTEVWPPRGDPDGSCGERG